MQVYKLKGKIDRSGKLIITEPTNLNPGEVEVIILQSATTENKSSNNELLENQNQLFWQRESLESLIDKQKPPIVQDLKMFTGDFWGKDSIEYFLTFLKQ
jgi:hypothetical protein